MIYVVYRSLFEKDYPMMTSGGQGAPCSRRYRRGLVSKQTGVFVTEKLLGAADARYDRGARFLLWMGSSLWELKTPPEKLTHLEKR